MESHRTQDRILDQFRRAARPCRWGSDELVFDVGGFIRESTLAFVDEWFVNFSPCDSTDEG
jgi:hypothetical protein